MTAPSRNGIVYNQIRSYQILYVMPHLFRPGASAKANVEYITKLKGAVGSDPRELGYHFSVWSVERFQKHLVEQTQVELSPTYLHKLMQKTSYRLS